jgi:hypothetical protein
VVLYQLLVSDFRRPVAGDWPDDITDLPLRDDLRHCLAGKPGDRFAAAALLARNLRALPERRAELEWRAAEKAALERAAYRRGMMRTVSIAAVIVAGFGLLALLALGQARRARKAEQAAEAERDATRRLLYASDMNGAQQALNEKDFGGAVRLLLRHRPAPGEEDLRGWEWRYLWRESQSDELFTLGRHQHQVTAVALSPDGHIAASAGSDGTVTLWDVTQRKELASLPHERRVTALAYSPNGRTLATQTQTETKIWDVEARRAIAHFPIIANSFLGCVAYSLDGRILFIAGGDGRIHLVDWASASEEGTLVGHKLAVKALAFSPDGRTLASGGYDASPPFLSS